jgi:hypothetical protein
MTKATKPKTQYVAVGYLNFYGSNKQRISFLRNAARDDLNTACQFFETRQDAIDAIAEDDRKPHYQQHNEYGRPEYKVKTLSQLTPAQRRELDYRNQ